MGTPAKSKMPVVGASNVEPIGIWKSFRVSIRSRHDRDHRLTTANLLATHFDVARRDSRGVLARALIAQQFFNGRWNTGRFQAHLFKFSAIPEQTQNPITDEIGCGLLTSNHCDNQVGDDLLLC